MGRREQHTMVAAIENGELIAHAALAGLDETERRQVRAALLTSSAGRHWLRDDPELSTERADELLAYAQDFRQPRRDRTLAAVIEHASLDALASHASAIAAGPAAPALWARLAGDHDVLHRLASMLVAGDDLPAAEATLHLLVLDPLDPLAFGDSPRGMIATTALASTFEEVRGLAAEYLAVHAPTTLQQSLDRLLRDESERVRAIAWDAALRVNRGATVNRASDLLRDESTAIAHRRSALAALGAALPTAQLADLLSYFVVHPDHDLASDAAELLFRQHRNPITAEAARHSPHADVRDVAERLLDPLRGSPAAGGSRPGDPTRSSADIYADMIRQLEAATDNHPTHGERSS